MRDIKEIKQTSQASKKDKTAKNKCTSKIGMGISRKCLTLNAYKYKMQFMEHMLEFIIGRP